MRSWSFTAAPAQRPGPVLALRPHRGSARHYAYAATRSLPFHTATTIARRAGPREHGRQASRSERDRPERASGLVCESATSAPPQAAFRSHRAKFGNTRHDLAVQSEDVLDDEDVHAGTGLV